MKDFKKYEENLSHWKRHYRKKDRSHCNKDKNLSGKLDKT